MPRSDILRKNAFLFRLAEIPLYRVVVVEIEVYRICKMDVSDSGCVCYAACTWHRAKVPPKWDNVMPFVLLSALEVKNTKGDLDALEIPFMKLTTFGHVSLAPNECFSWHKSSVNAKAFFVRIWCYLASYEKSTAWGQCSHFFLLRQADGVKPPRKDGKMGWDL